MAVLSKPVSEPPVDLDENQIPVIELDENGIPVYHPVEIFCKLKGKNTSMWKVEEHKLAVDFLKKHVPVWMSCVIA